jgi:hypothetical protein
MYNARYRLVVCKTTSGYALTIVDTEHPTESVAVRLLYNAWIDYAECVSTLFDDLERIHDVSDVLDFTNMYCNNTATSTVITGVLVDLSNTSAFRRQSVEYRDSDTDLFYSKLFEAVEHKRPRTIIITESSSIAHRFDIRIVSPSVAQLSAAGVPLDPDLDADNPYAIRDVYNSAAPTVQGIIPYVPTRRLSDKGELIYSPEKISASSDTEYKSTSQASEIYDVHLLELPREDISYRSKDNASLTVDLTYADSTFDVRRIMDPLIGIAGNILFIVQDPTSKAYTGYIYVQFGSIVLNGERVYDIRPIELSYGNPTHLVTKGSVDIIPYQLSMSVPNTYKSAITSHIGDLIVYALKSKYSQQVTGMLQVGNYAGLDKSAIVVPISKTFSDVQKEDIYKKCTFWNTEIFESLKEINAINNLSAYVRIVNLYKHYSKENGNYVKRLTEYVYHIFKI